MASVKSIKAKPKKAKPKSAPKLSRLSKISWPSIIGKSESIAFVTLAHFLRNEYTFNVLLEEAKVLLGEVHFSGIRKGFLHAIVPKILILKSETSPMKGTSLIKEEVLIKELSSLKERSNLYSGNDIIDESGQVNIDEEVIKPANKKMFKPLNQVSLVETTKLDLVLDQILLGNTTSIKVDCDFSKVEDLNGYLASVEQDFIWYKESLAIEIRQMKEGELEVDAKKAKLIIKCYTNFILTLKEFLDKPKKKVIEPKPIKEKAMKPTKADLNKLPQVDPSSKFTTIALFNRQKVALLENPENGLMFLIKPPFTQKSAKRIDFNGGLRFKPSKSDLAAISENNFDYFDKKLEERDLNLTSPITFQPNFKIVMIQGK